MDVRPRETTWPRGPSACLAVGMDGDGGTGLDRQWLLSLHTTRVFTGYAVGSLAWAPQPYTALQEEVRPLRSDTDLLPLT